MTITTEPTVPEQRTSEVNDLIQQASLHLSEGQAEEAESLLRQVIELESPPLPDVLNNLSVAYLQQQQYDEAEALVERIYRDYPDYFFGRCNYADLLRRRGECEAAIALLNTTFSTSETHHVSEARGYARVRLAIAAEQDDERMGDRMVELLELCDRLESECRAAN